MRSCDVLVAGAGPAGAVTAALLARAGRSVLLVAPCDEAGHKVGESLPGPAAQLLRRLDLPGPREGGPHERISGVRSNWGNAVSRKDAFTDPGGGDWRIDRRRFDHELRAAALKSGAVELYGSVTDLGREGRSWRVTTAGGETVHAETVIDATGRRALIARRLGIPQQSDEPIVSAWAVGERCSGKHGTQTLIETTVEGWWYGAFLPDGAPIAIYHCGPSTAALLRKNPDEWRNLLSRTELIAADLPMPLFRQLHVHFTDARGLMLDSTCGDGWFACGDAAISFNPLASQGLFNAISSAAMVVKSMEHANPLDARARYQAHIHAVRERYLLQLEELERDRLVLVHR